MDCCGSMFLLFWYGMGDHKSVMVNITHQSILVEQVLKVVRPKARRLQCGFTGPKNWYLQKCETLFQVHNVYIKARGVYISARYPPPPGFTEKLHKVDKERDQYMKNAENKCRKRRISLQNP